MSGLQILPCFSALHLTGLSQTEWSAGMGGAHMMILTPSLTSRSCFWEENMSCVPHKEVQAVRRRKIQAPRGWGADVTGCEVDA